MRTPFSFLVAGIFLFCSCQQNQDTLFQRLSPKKTGIVFKNILRESKEFNVMKYSYFYNGGGVAIGDINNDGLPDVYFTGNLVASHLYLNQGDFKFSDIAGEAGVEAAGLWNTGVTMADVNGDGLLDIYICRSAAKDPDARRNLLFINKSSSDGKIRFEEEATIYGLNDQGYSTHAAFFDMDRDGDLDMYLLNHSLPEFADFNNFIGNLKLRRNSDFGDKLYRNDDGKFQDITHDAGIKSNVLGFGLGVAISDLNNDDWPDIYVSNDFNEEDYLYINNQDGSFTEQLSQSMDHTSLFSMGSDAADINNDLASDVVTLDMLPNDNYRIKLTSGPDNFEKYNRLLDQGFYRQTMRNMLQVNDGKGNFREVGQLAGVSNTDWSWSALIADYDLDGWQDLFVTNGYLRDYTNMDFLSFAVDMKAENPDMGSDADIEELLKHMPKIEVPNQIFKNLDGSHFRDLSKTWGFNKVELSNGAAYGDLDNDGDLDLVVNNVNDFAGIYRNTSRERNMGNFLKIRLDRDEKGTAIGTKIRLFADSTSQQRELFLSRGFQSSVEPQLYFGLGQRSKIDSLIIRWPDGALEKFDYVPINKLFIAKQGTGEKKNPTNFKTEGMFQKDTIIEFRHKENDFNDFRIQSLLPKYYSRQGPPLAAADINHDQLPDVICGGANGQPAEVFLGTRSGHLVAMPQGDFISDKNFEDVDLSLCDLNQDGYPDLLVASGGNAYPDGDSLYTLRCYLNDGNGQFKRHWNFPKIITNASCLATGDLNQDGLMDIFVGSAYKAQQYPLPAQNYILINDGSGSFTVQPEFPFSSTIVMDAVIGDYDADGQNELITVGEWQPLSTYALTGNTWQKKHSASEKGWYNTVSLINLDSDPQLEFVVGNLGLNSQWNASREKPIILYYSDFDDNKTIDPILSCYVGDQSYPFVSRDDLVGQLPSLKKLFTSYQDYANTTMKDLLLDLPGAQTDTINDLRTSIYDFSNNALNQIPLPLEVQISPVFSIMGFDYDQDGDQDLLFTGNNEFNRVKVGEMDANHGLLLQNNGRFNFRKIESAITGLYIRGDVRSCVYLDYGAEKYFLFGINNRNVVTYKFDHPIQ